MSTLLLRTKLLPRMHATCFVVVSSSGLVKSSPARRSTQNYARPNASSVVILVVIYIYLLTCTRVCSLCLFEDKKFLPLRYGQATRKFGIPRHILDTLPHMKSISGSYCTYSPNGKKVHDRLTLVDSEFAYHLGITLHGSLVAVE